MALLHSIYLTGGQTDAEGLPWRIAANIDALKAHHPDVEHRLFGDESLRAFIAANFDRDVLSAYEQLAPLSCKADLGRYCLLFKNGGVYADLGVHVHKPIADVHAINRLHVFRDAFNQAPWIVSTSLIAAPPSAPIFQHCIKGVIANVRSGWYGSNPLCPTGPNLFGRTIAALLEPRDLVLGETVRISRGGNSYAYVDSAGDVIAVNIKAGSGLTSLGAEKSDNYNTHYANRTLYGDQLHEGVRWSAEDYRNNGWFRTGQDGFEPGDCIFGPYADLQAGDYEATVILGVQSADAIDLAHDVVSHGGKIVVSPPLPLRLNGGSGSQEVRIPFSIDRPHHGVEFRVTFTSRARAEVLGSRLVQILDGEQRKGAQAET